MTLVIDQLHLSVAHRYAANPDEWPLAPRFDPARRWYHRLSAENEDGSEVWLLSWLPGQGTDWHDHGGSAGAFVVVSGELVEQTIDSETVHIAQSGREFGAHHIHRMTNRGRRPAVSIHVYGPALKIMTRYRLQAGELQLAGIDRAGAQW